MIEQRPHVAVHGSDLVADTGHLRAGLAWVTAAGARMLSRRLASPLRSASEIGKRLDGVGYFFEQPTCHHRPEILQAEAGQGAWRGLLDTPLAQFERLQVSTVDKLGKATLSTGNLATLARAPQWNELGRLVPQLHRIRGYGDFVHYHYLAAGKLEAVVESDVNILDIAALAVIVREAGGCFTDLNGRPLNLETRTVLATNGLVHEAFAGLALPAMG